MYESLRQKSSFPRHSFSTPKRGGGTPPEVRLSIIAEDGVVPPRAPATTYHRPFSRRWNLGDPPRPSFETPPPKYAATDVAEPTGEKLIDIKNNKYVARRGGWRRTCLIALMLAAAVIALVVGLVVGLRNKARKSSTSTELAPSDAPSPLSPSLVGPFPIGTYSFETFLANVTTNCASKSNDWQCAPYRTYAESPSEAKLPFQWIISGSKNDDSSSNLTIVSANNPFTVNFAQTPLTLVDNGQDNERYTFTTSFDKVVFITLGVACFFNNTTMEANIYTKRPKSYPPSNDPSSPTPSATPTPPASNSASSPASSSSPVPYADWAYAVDINQSLGGGASVPECYQMNDGVRGARVMDGRVPKSETDVCSCIYRNYDS